MAEDPRKTDIARNLLLGRASVALHVPVSLNH